MRFRVQHYPSIHPTYEFPRSPGVGGCVSRRRSRQAGRAAQEPSGDEVDDGGRRLVRLVLGEQVALVVAAGRTLLGHKPEHTPVRRKPSTDVRNSDGGARLVSAFQREMCVTKTSAGGAATTVLLQCYTVLISPPHTLD